MAYNIQKEFVFGSIDSPSKTSNAALTRMKPVKEFTIDEIKKMPKPERSRIVRLLWRSDAFIKPASTC